MTRCKTRAASCSLLPMAARLRSSLARASRPALPPLAVESIGAFEQFVDETYTPFMAPGVLVRPQPCPVGATPQPSATRPASPAPLIDQPRPSAERARRVQPAFLLLFLSRQYPPPLAAPAARGDEVGARCRRVWTLHTRSPPAHAGRAMTDRRITVRFSSLIRWCALPRSCASHPATRARSCAHAGLC